MTQKLRLSKKHKLKKYVSKKHVSKKKVNKTQNGQKGKRGRTNKFSKNDFILQLHGGSVKNKVLIVVDVQNCFIEHFGTFKWSPKKNNKESINNEKKRYNLHKDNFINQLMTFIDTAKNEYDIIVFTKDRHPKGHYSFGIYPPHCVNELKTCITKKYLNTNVKQKQERDDITGYQTNKGHELISKSGQSGQSGKLGKLEHLLYDYKISYDDNIHINEDTTELYNIDLSGQQKYSYYNVNKIENHTKTITEVNFEQHNEKTDAIIVRLNKGELCNFDAYGAFLYHIQYNKNEKGEPVDTNILFQEEIKNNKHDLRKLSTGLGEFITQYYVKSKGIKTLSDITIDVCGVVTNICVVNTCITGYKMFEYLNTQTDTGMGIPKFKLLNQYCLNLYPLELHASNIIEMAGIEYKIYSTDDSSNADDKYNSDADKKSISIINNPSVDNYIIPQPLIQVI